MVTPNDVAPLVPPVAFVAEGVEAEPGTESPVSLAPVDFALPPKLPSKRHIAKGVPVVAFTGLQGAGKTLLAVSCLVAEIAHGKKVYSTVPISSAWGESTPLVSLRQLLHIERDSIVFMDDVSVIFPSTLSATSLPNEIEILFDTIRHSGNGLWWTAPQWMRANNRLRQITQGLVNVVPLLKKSVGDSPWKTPRLIGAGLMDTATGKADSTPEKRMRTGLYIPSRLLGWGAYDTYADTPHLGVRRVARSCPDCGGSYPPIKHSRELHDSLGVPWFDD